MNRRLIWGGITLVAAVAGFIISGNPVGKILPLVLAGIVAIAAFQTIWNFNNFSEAVAIFDKEQTPLLRRLLAGGSLAAIGIAAVVSFGDRAGAAETSTLREKGVVTQATVTDAYSSSGRRRGTTYTLKLKFTDQAGILHEVEEGVGGSEFFKITTGQSPQLNIIYCPDDLDLLDVLSDDEIRAQYGK